MFICVNMSFHKYLHVKQKLELYCNVTLGELMFCAVMIKYNNVLILYKLNFLQGVYIHITF